MTLFLALSLAGQLVDTSTGRGTLFQANPVGRTEYIMGLDEAGFGSQPDELLVGSVQRVELTSVHWLGGPKPAHQPHYVYLTMANGRIHWKGPILVMTRADGKANSFNNPHEATQHWIDVRDSSCLDEASVKDWQAEPFFDAPDKDGVRCLLRPGAAH